MAYKKQKLGPWQSAWLRSLESGEHRQTKNYLTIFDNDKNTYRHCCLGIACEVLITNGVEIPFAQKPSIMSDNFDVCTYGSCNDTLPPNVINTMKFHNELGLIGTPNNIVQYSAKRRRKLWLMKDEYYSLANMNDEGLSFKQIAKYVRLSR